MIPADAKCLEGGDSLTGVTEHGQGTDSLNSNSGGRIGQHRRPL